MNKNQKIAVGVIYAAYFTVVAVWIIRARKEHRAVMASIKAESLAQLAAMDRAAAIVRQKITNGDYRGRPIADLHSDLEFYTIMEREK